ncbi:MAG: nucleoside phosphorylase [Chloroflexota bacterium]
MSKPTEHSDNPIPLSEYEDTVPAIIEPSNVITKIPDFPERIVLCFFQDAIKSICDDDNIIGHTGSEIGLNPIYKLTFNDMPIAIMHAGMGAPLSGAFLDEVIAMGADKIIACGGAGVLDSSIEVGDVIVPNSAIRDEGTSFHYLPPSREVQAHPDGVKACVDTLEAHSISYQIGKTWTTDAIYRETPTKIKRRRAEGALTVEMETSAFFAIAQFRKVTFGQFLYGGDDVSAEDWDSRAWHKKQASAKNCSGSPSKQPPVYKN